MIFTPEVETPQKIVCSIYLKSVIIWFDLAHVTNVGIFLDVWCGNTSNMCVSQFESYTIGFIGGYGNLRIYAYLRFLYWKNNKPEYLTLSCITRWCLLLKAQSLESQPKNVRLCLLSPRTGLQVSFYLLLLRKLIKCRLLLLDITRRYHQRWHEISPSFIVSLAIINCRFT